MKLQTPRPEDRSRQGTDSPAWVDTRPACFRSEGFAEDLPEDADAAPGDAQRGTGLMGGTVLPMLGLALAGVISVFAS